MRPKKTGLIGNVIALRDKWRFKEGEKLYVYNWKDQEHPVTVERRVPREQLPHSDEMADAITCSYPTMPHYECSDYLGGTHLLAQMWLSTRPILERES